MAIPLVYNIESIRLRFASTIVAVLGIAGTVGVFVAMLAMAHGFQATLMSSGSSRNAIARRAGATSETDSTVSLDQVRIIADSPEVERRDTKPLVSGEIVVIATFPLLSTGTDANVQLRGVDPTAFLVRDNVRIVQGRAFNPGLPELAVGRNAQRNYAGLQLGKKISFGGNAWSVVGVLDSGGSAFDSEVWADASVLAQAFQRPTGYVQSVTARLTSEGAFPTLRERLLKDPRLTLQLDREVDYYEKESKQLTTLIVVLGSLVAFVMGIGAVFGALNTMYSTVAERSREIATIRAIGFGFSSVVWSFMFEALAISLVGGLLGCLLVLPINGLTTGTLNFQTFSHLAFAFQVTPRLLLAGLGFALAMGLLGGIPPAVRAARLPVAVALRDL